MMPPTRGLTLGKFAPLHCGHQLLIDTALAEVDELVITIYDCPETTRRGCALFRYCTWRFW